MPTFAGRRVLPLTRQQRAMWAAQRLGGGDAYNIPIVHQLAGPLDAAALDRALCRLIARHPVLRSRSDAQGTLLQVSDQIPERVLRVREVTGQDCHALAVESARTPLDPDGPLRLRADLFRSGPQEAVLLLLLDHIVVDAPSVGLLLNDLSALYAESADGCAPHRDPGEQDGYFAYAIAQKDYEESPEGRRDEDFWVDYLQGVTVLPAVAERSADGGSGPRTSSVGVRVPENLGHQCEQRGITPFAALLGAYSLTLQHYFRTDDIVIGYPAVDWRRSRYPHVVGLYSEMLPFRPPARQGRTAGEYIEETQDSLLDCLAHQGGSLAKAWAAVRSGTQSVSASVFPALMSFNEATADEALRLSGVEARRVPVVPRDGKAGLLLSVNADGAGFTGRLDFVRDQYPAHVARSIARAVETVLGQVLSNPGPSVLQVALVGDEDRAGAAAHGRPEPHAPSRALVVEAFAEQVATRPGDTALIEGERRVTYRELDDESRRLAARIAALGLPGRSTVALCLPRSAAFVVAVLAVLRSGMAYLPVDTAQPARRHAFVMKDAGAAAVLVGDARAREQLSTELPVIDVGGCDDVDEAGEFTDVRVEGTQPAYLITTSGTTGLPKAVVVPHRAIANNLTWKRRAFGLGPQDRFYFKTPPVFDASVWEYLVPLTIGASVVIAGADTHRDPAALLADMRRHDVTVAQFVPTLLKALPDEEGLSGCPSLRWLFCGGEQLDRAVVRMARRTSTARVVNLYGPTEATIDATYHVCDVDDDSGPVMPIGRPVDGAHTYVLGAGGQILPPGFTGELHLGGIVLADGYVNREQLTAERFVAAPAEEHTGLPTPRLYRTGDLVRGRADGVLEFIGREDGQVKIRGLRVDLDGIRSVLLEHGDVKDALVVVHPRREDALVAYVVAPEGTTAEDVLGHLAERLPAEQLPAYVVRLDELPVTATGKADARALPVPEAGQDATARTAPRTALEERLTALWAGALGVAPERVPRSVSLFELGGSSLTLIQLHSSIRAELSLEVPVTDLFKYPTVSALADALGRRVRTPQN
ncbi:amino acid adenylation domain-containing protein [Streptomyces sp. Isolate_45]|uniref:non-ribosomal peptide synthetase n=1 Tax=Streptomyces sp. Isolate_45 TaxID=2950111 RepID=UPI002481A621|nr:amino acid adenylation domain-containing protein [Streptomyces sp. Isolate_45]MDA5280546.1 amino acid adenylation domain-containing protein [Streptomyces sp. Isolate_45]